MKTMMMFMPVIKSAMLLTVSFFVLFTASKTKDEGLKQFGRITAIVLWAIAASVIILTLYSSYVGNRCSGGMGYSKAQKCTMMMRR